ncbi:MAG: hypothetical protein K2M79_00925 [Muribaculaceae bacterium]|nr:hypothetical protein [Muribaculaceae bacterium]
MRKILRTVTAVLLCGALMTPVAEARGRNNSNNGGGGAPSAQSRPGNAGQRPSGSTSSSKPGGASSRPGNSGNNHNSGGNPGNHTRPGNSGGSYTRPGNTGGSHNPGGNPGNHTRPNPGHNNNWGHNNPGPRPGNATPPGHRPGGHYHPGVPSRPYLPPPRPYYRPTPPPTWRPVRPWRPFETILGIALGTTINISLNALVGSGYAIAGYGNNAIYLTNVPMLNVYWPDATMFYGSNGGLVGSRFEYYTPGYNTSRYDTAYSALVSTYGAPVSVTNNGTGVTATWWGTGNQYITLSFAGQYAANGTYGYFTTLSFGI